MATLRMNVAAVLALAESVRDTADRLDEIRWPTVSSDDMAGSSVLSAAASSSAEDRLAAVVAHMRTWAVAAQASAVSIQEADAHPGAPR